MKKLKFFAFIMLINLLVWPSFAQFTRQQAIDKVLNEILPADTGNINLYIATDVYTGSENIELPDGSLILNPFENNYVFFVNDFPFANWNHPCRYIFISQATGDYSVVYKNVYPLGVNDDFTVVLEIPVPVPANLPVNTEAVVTGLSPNPNLYAVLISGKINNNPNINDTIDKYRFSNDVAVVYNTLIDVYGYKKENIFVHFYIGSGTNPDYDDMEDFDGYPYSNDIDYPAYKERIEETFLNMSGEMNTDTNVPVLKPGDQLLVYVTNHGDGGYGTDISSISLPDPQNNNLTIPLYDFELEESLKGINCSQMIFLMQQCYSGGFIADLMNVYDNGTKCKNRLIYTDCDINEWGYGEKYITGLKYDEFTYYWSAALRGFYPNSKYPWLLSHSVSEFPFEEEVPLFGFHPDDYSPDDNNDGYIQLDEAFDYANNFDTWSEYEYFNPYPNSLPNWKETPQTDYTTSLDEFQTLCGFAGKIDHDSNLEQERSFLLGGDIEVIEDANLTIADEIELYFGNENTKLSSNPGSELIIGNDVSFIGTNTNNQINVNGGFQIGQNVTFTSTGPLWDVFLNNTSLQTVFDNTTFEKCRLHNHGQSLTITYSTFNDCYIVDSHRGNVTVTDNTSFNRTWLYLENTEDNNNTATISKCSFTTDYTMVAIDLWNYAQYEISNNTIDGYYNGIQLSQSGFGIAKKQKIIDNIITNCNQNGIIAYNSLGSVYRNHINNNRYGAWFGNNSNIRLYGNSGASSNNQTQEITDNTSYEVYASQNSFPIYFRYNVIIDEDNAGAPSDPLVYYSAGLGELNSLDVRYNCWGVNFNAAQDFYPSSYIWSPIWCPGNNENLSASPDEDMYEAANNLFETENFADAKSMYELLVNQYPESKFAKAALHELFALEKFATNDYNSLKQYYATNSTIQSDTALAKLGNYLVSKCDVKLEYWSDAIGYCENIIQSPESFEDSIFAIIDLGYVYFVMENSGYKSAYTGKLTGFKPASKEQFIENRNYLLSLIPGDHKSETLNRNIAELKEGELLQNVPNPFSGTTNIWYKIENECVIQLNIYNYTGQKIKSIDEGTQPKGTHFIEFDAKGLKDGVYLYSIFVNGEKTYSKKMTIMN